MREFNTVQAIRKYTGIFSSRHTHAHTHTPRPGRKGEMSKGMRHSESDKLGPGGFRVEVTALEICFLMLLCVGSSQKTEGQASLSNKWQQMDSPPQLQRNPLK